MIRPMDMCAYTGTEVEKVLVVGDDRRKHRDLDGPAAPTTWNGTNMTIDAPPMQHIRDGASVSKILIYDATTI